MTLAEDEPSSCHKSAEAAGEKEVGDGDEVQKGDQIIINPDILYWLSFIDF